MGDKSNFNLKVQLGYIWASIMYYVKIKNATLDIQLLYQRCKWKVLSHNKNSVSSLGYYFVCLKSMVKLIQVKIKSIFNKNRQN